MEFASTSIIAFVIIVALFIFRSSIKRLIGTTNKAIDQVNDVVIVNILESRADITERTQEAMKKLDELGGPVDLEAAYNDPEVYGYWREEEEKNPGKGHWSDKYKKDSHITYSVESILGDNPK